MYLLYTTLDTMNITLWTFPEDYFSNFQLDLKLKSDEGGDTSTYILNGEWDLIGTVGSPMFLYPINVTSQLVAVLNYGFPRVLNLYILPT